MTLNDCITDYLAYLRHEQGAALTTFKGYQAWLHNLQNWLSENGYPNTALSDFNTATLRRYLYHLSGRGLRPRTIRGAFHAIRGLSRFLVTAGALPENPSSPLTLPKLDAAERKTVSDEEISQLLDACRRQHSPFKVACSKAILSVLVYGGLRRQELLDLRVSDADIAAKSILVRSGKGSKSRKIYICDSGIDALAAWLSIRPQNCRHDYLFALDANRRVSQIGLRTLIEEVKAIAGLADHDNIKPHSLRHAAATRLLRNGANLRDIQTYLGHSSLQVTSIYLHSNEEQAKSIAELTALHPAGAQAGSQGNGKIIRLPQSTEREQIRRRIAR